MFDDLFDSPVLAFCPSLFLCKMVYLKQCQKSGQTVEQASLALDHCRPFAGIFDCFYFCAEECSLNGASPLQLSLGSHCNGKPDSFSHAYPISDTHAHRNSHTYPQSHANTNTDAGAYAYSDSHSRTNTHSRASCRGKFCRSGRWCRCPDGRSGHHGVDRRQRQRQEISQVCRLQQYEKSRGDLPLGCRGPRV